MPAKKPDVKPPFRYPFAIPAVNLGVEDSSIAPPYLAKAVGLDGRYLGSLRRFPGFRVVRNIQDHLDANFTGIDRIWYTSIQKGASADVIRGFVVLADSPTATHKALYFAYYDTGAAAWATTEILVDFGDTDPYKGAYVLGSYYAAATGLTSGTASIHSLAWIPDRSALYMAMGGTFGGVSEGRLLELDPTSGRVRRTIGQTLSVSVIAGISYNTSNSTLYACTLKADTPQSRLGTLNLDDGSFTEIANISPDTSLHDIAWHSGNSKMYGTTYADEGTASILHTINLATGALTDPQGMDFNGCQSLFYDEDNDKLYAMTRSELRELDPSDGSSTLKLTFLDYDLQEPTGVGVAQRYRGIAMPNAGVFHAISGGDTGRYIEMNLGAAPYSFDDVDVSSTWRYIYATFAATGQRREYNRAFFWDVSLATPAMAGRTAGWTKPATALQNPTRLTTGGVLGDSKRVFSAITYRSRRHATRSPIGVPLRRDTAAGPTGTHLLTQHIDVSHRGTDLALSDLVVELWRGIGTDENLTTEDVVLMGNLYLDRHDANVNAGETEEYDFASSAMETGCAPSDIELTTRQIYNPIRDYTGLFPRSSRILGMDRQLFVVAVPNQGDDPVSPYVDIGEKAAQRVMWSPPEKFDLENFRGALTGEMYRQPDVGDKILTLKRAGDFVIAAAQRGFIRLHKSGAFVAVNPVSAEWGIESRDGIAAVGSRVLFATAQGLMEVDAASLRISAIGAMRRVLTTADYWRNSLASVIMAYDSALGAIILFNSSTEEMYLLWPETGGVTSLEDCPFVHGVEGVHPVDGGPQRSFWVTEDGLVLTPDAEETATRKTMCGVSSGKTGNGTATSGTTTTLVDSGATFDGTNMKRFYVHFLSGDNAGAKRQIASIAGTTITLAVALSNAVAAGDRYSIAPIPMRVRGWQVLYNNRIDHFNRKIVNTMSAVVRLRGGSTDPETNPNMKITYEMYKRFSVDGSPDASAEVTLSEDPTTMHGATPIAGPLLYPEWVCLSSDLDLELLAGDLSGRIPTAEADSGP